MSLAPNVDRPAVHLAHADERLDQLALAVALDAGDTDDLPGPHLQVEPVDGPLAPIVVDLQSGDVEHDVARVGVALLDLQHDAAPDHHVGQPGPVRLLRGRRADDLAAAQHRDRVAHRDRLAQLVGDEDDRRALLGQLAHAPSSSSSVSVGREHGRRLVEDEDVGLPVQRLEDLDALLRADREVLDQCARVDAQPVLARRAAGCARRPRSVSSSPACVDSSPSMMFSATVNTGTSWKCWCTMPTPRRDGVARSRGGGRPPP